MVHSERDKWFDPKLGFTVFRSDMNMDSILLV